MRFVINDREVTLPTSLAEYTLGQRIAFQEAHGDELDKMAESISKMPDGSDKELETLHYSFEKMFRTFAFFTNTDVDALKESDFIDDIANIYYSSLAVLLEEEQQLELQHEFIWKKETWVLSSPQLTAGHKMKFGEFIDAKQMIKNMVDLGKGKWGYMLPLCAIFFRKKDEPYHESFLYDGSDRLKLMEDLPMNIAMQVGFFLSSSMNIYLNTLSSSGSRV